MNAWMKQWFDEAQQTAKGGVARRSVSSVKKQASVDAAVEEARKRGWHLIETGGQLVLLCHKGVVKILS